MWGGNPCERGKSINQRGRPSCSSLLGVSGSPAPPPIRAEAVEALCDWPSLPHLGLTIVSCQKWLRRGDNSEVGSLVAVVG